MLKEPFVRSAGVVGVDMARFAFVSRKGLDLLQEVSFSCPCPENPTVTHHCTEPESFGYRVVFAFFEGQFTLDEIERFMCDLVGSSGTAPVAEDYFKAYNSDSRINTGGISFQKDMHIPRRTFDIMVEFNGVKFIDELSFQTIQAEWFGLLRSLEPVLLSVKEF